MELIDLLARWGAIAVFAAVMVEQAGLPLPAAPVLIAAGALAQSGEMRAESALAAAFIACFVADQLWFRLGRRHGRSVLAMMCRLSLSPDTCVRKTDDLIIRHGSPMLLVAKFIPGVSAIAVPTAAATGLSYRRFLLFDSLGALLWSSAYLAAGMIFSREVHQVLDWLSKFGGGSLSVFGVLLAIYLAWKVLRRLRLQRLHRLVRISPTEIAALLDLDPDLLILDARSSLARRQDPRVLPRSMVFDDRASLKTLPATARQHTIVTFCTCPNDASATLIAEQLLNSGYERVRVLTGGKDALAMLGG